MNKEASSQIELDVVSALAQSMPVWGRVTCLPLGTSQGEQRHEQSGGGGWVHITGHSGWLQLL